ncbi:MAG: cation:proton antiporter, partial [Bdellovibrionota bacterium]
MEHTLINDLATLLVAAAAVSLLCYKLQMPVIVGYILVGAALSPFSPFPLFISEVDQIKVWGEIGVVFVMFHLGLEFSFRRLKNLGFSTLFIGAFEIGLMIILGWGLASALGFTGISRFFVGSMIAISSTTVIMKTFTDKKLRAKRFAERVVGLLIFEDLAAVLIIVGLTATLAGRSFGGAELVLWLTELVVVIGGWYIVGAFLIPRFVRYVGESENEEMLVLLALGLCLGLAVAAAQFHYSMALGAFIMGSILNETREAERIERMIRPLRDVFAAVFFVSVGLLADFSFALDRWPTVLALTLAVFFGKIVFVFAGAVLSGENVRTSTRMALSMGQIGEFSFIIAGLGITSGLMAPELQPIIVSVSILTAFMTPFAVKISAKLGPYLEEKMPRAHASRLIVHQDRMRDLADGRLIPRWIRPGLARLVVNAIVVAIIFGVVRRFLTPFLDQ